jgi:hypothetical protein
MARGIIVVFDGEQSDFELARLDRDRLYGKKVMEVLDDQGERCVPALLSRDGSMLLPPGGTTRIYVDDRFDTVERSEVKPVDADGVPLTMKPSTLGVAQTAALVPPERVLDHTVTAVYELAPTAIGANLRAALEGGAIAEIRFNYRNDYDDSPAFLLKNEAGFFALVASPTGFEMLRRDATPVPESAEPDAGDEDLDFSMM